MNAEEWRDLVGAYLDAASAAVTEIGGKVAKKLGDGLMALFGYPMAQENDAERAVRAALAIQRALEQLNPLPQSAEHTDIQRCVAPIHLCRRRAHEDNSSSNLISMVQAINALLAGEIDYIEQPPHDLLPLLQADENVKLVDSNPLGNQYTFRPNHLQKPFDNPKIRQALWYAFNQKDFLDATIGNPEYYSTCKAMFVCGSPLASDKGMDGLLVSNFERARALLKEANYDGTPIVLMHSTDLQVLTNLAPVAKSLMERAGFKVDMQSMDWQTLVARRAKKDPANAGGWHAFLTAWVSADILNPVMTALLNSSCDKAIFGWPCDEEMEKLRDAFTRETDPVKQKADNEASSQVPHVAR
jgi:ABC-type transport system substrate-binding protein